MGCAPPRAPARIALALALAASLAAGSAGAWCQTSVPHAPPGLCTYGVPVSWAVSCLGVHLNRRALRDHDDAGQDLDALARDGLARALAAWNGADCGGGRVPALQLVDAGDVDLARDLALDGRNVVSVNRQWTPDPFHRPGTIAITVVSADTRSGALLEGDIEINALSLENPLGRIWGDGAPMWGRVDAPSVMLHEVGHLAGLWHSLTDGAVMEASMDIERQRRALTADDRAGVCTVYDRGPIGPRAARCAAERPASLPTTHASGGCSLNRERGSSGWRGIGLLILGWLTLRRRASRGDRSSAGGSHP